MYCRRCDKDDVGGFHKCFIAITGDVILPLKKRPDPKKRVSYRLLQKIKQHPELGIWLDEDSECERLYVGCHQRSQGAWLWSVKKERPTEIGSCSTMMECLNAKKWVFYRSHGQIEIIPE